MNRYLRALALSVLPALLPVAAAAQQACSAAEYRQFDFWVGKWEVTAKDRVAGHNDITVEEGGCVVHEHWTGAKGGTGQSFNVYDQSGKRWHQFWVDNSGTVLHLTGGLAGGVMSLTGTTAGSDGKTMHQRLSFTPNADGSVRQLWEQSADGTAWAVVFDGLYRKQ